MLQAPLQLLLVFSLATSPAFLHFKFSFPCNSAPPPPQLWFLLLPPLPKVHSWPRSFCYLSPVLGLQNWKSQRFTHLPSPHTVVM